MQNAYSIVVDGLSVKKHGELILSDLSMELSNGLTALLGRNGAGKTTLMRVLAGVLLPTSGTVSTSAGLLHRTNSETRKHLSALGWVPQGPGYPGGMRVDKFVEYASWLKLVESRRTRAATLHALDICNIAQLRKRPIKSLSGGERQRVILASAIVGEPRFLLLDEPTAGLDPAQRESYLMLLRALSETTTVLYSTHLVEDVVRTASRVLVLDRGRISADLTGNDLAGPSDQLSDRLREAVIASDDRNLPVQRGN
ncbi:ABC transporter ATP-binding protein [Arthrobacter tecti]